MDVIIDEHKLEMCREMLSITLGHLPLCIDTIHNLPPNTQNT